MHGKYKELNFFLQMVFGIWNVPPEWVVEASQQALKSPMHGRLVNGNCINGYWMVDMDLMGQLVCFVQYDPMAPC